MKAKQHCKVFPLFCPPGRSANKHSIFHPTWEIISGFLLPSLLTLAHVQ